jgi:predicted nuclease with TOPRIM domain
LNEEFVGETKANIKTLFKQDEELKEKTEKLEEGQKQLDKLTYILELQQGLNKEQTHTLNNINDNLVKLNGTVKTLENSVGNLSGRVVSLEESGKIDTREIKKELIYKVLPGAIIGLGVGLLVAFLANKLGWNINL